jgi:hypothetical protein
VFSGVTSAEHGATATAAFELLPVQHPRITHLLLSAMPLLVGWLHLLLLLLASYR